ncbi:MAG: hypothetical protein ACOY5U_16030 [Pseudomonadota bacterium]
MSDPTMNREVEDVLSSIRRLVAQDRSHRSGGAAPAPGATEAAPGALVLTPALRVVEGDPGATSDDDRPGDARDEAIGFDSGRIRGDMVLAALGAVGPIGQSRRADDALDQAGGWAMGAGAGPEPEPPESGPFDHPDPSDEPAPHTGHAWADAGAGHAPRPLADDLASLETTIAELEAAVAGIDEDFEADGGEDDSLVATDRAPLWLAPDAPDAIAPGMDADAPPAADDLDAETAAAAAMGWRHAPSEDAGEAPAETPVAEAGAELSVSARRLHLATEVASGPEEDAADLPGIADPHPAEDVPETSRSRIFVRRPAVVEAEPDLAPTPPVPTSLEPPDAVGADAGGGAPGSRPDDGAGPASGQPAIDLETLRLLVAEVLRQELRGPLGERITQNVRKLVRREIHRVLDSRDFE